MKTTQENVKYVIDKLDGWIKEDRECKESSKNNEVKAYFRGRVDATQYAKRIIKIYLEDKSCEN